MSLVPVPEVRRMIETAKKFVAKEIHFSYLTGPLEECVWWSRVHGTHPAIQRLATDWQTFLNMTWNEFGQYKQAMPVEEFRRRVAEDLGMI